MVDMIHRAAMAELLRHFAAGRVTNDQFEASFADIWRAARRRDRALWEVFWLSWHFYDDLHEHRLAGRHALSKQARRTFARCVVFLHSEHEYDWPRLGWGAKALNLLTWGRWRWRVFQQACPGQAWEEIWPFRTKADLERAAARPRLLAGVRVLK